MAINDQDKIRRADKALASRADTSANRDPWDEALGRDQQGVLEGLAGSWAAFYANDLRQGTINESSTPAPIQAKVSKLGQPGMPEINFRPFDLGSNRFGSKGPSLLGHPISFSVVGPTLKSPYLDSQWDVVDNSLTPGLGDQLILDTARNVYGAGAPIATTIANMYGITSLADFPGGLYLFISQTGDRTGTINGITAGLGDGSIYTDGGANLRTAISPRTETSKYEIFRVVAISGATLTLDPAKRLSTYFSIPFGGPPTPALRAITLIEPYVTRLQAMPGSGSGVGHEQAFAVIAPEITANSDLSPPFDGGVAGDGSWVRQGFDELEPGSATGVYPGTITHYFEGAKVPIPVPIEYKQGVAVGMASDYAVLPTAGAAPGTWYIFVPAAYADAGDVGKILNIYATERRGDSPFKVLTGGSVSDNAVLGQFEVLSVYIAPDLKGTYVLKRLPEIDPLSGKVTHALDFALFLDNLASGTFATGTITVLSAAPSPATITIAGNTLTATLGARTPGNDDYDASLGSTGAIAVEIAAAIADPANSFNGTVTAAFAGGDNVTVTSQHAGGYGNFAVSTSDAGAFTVPSSLTQGTQDDLKLFFTTQDPVGTLYTAPYVDLDKVNSVRLPKLIDPTEVGRSGKVDAHGSTAFRADRAIFDTSSSGAGASGTNANPGSLLDLGFRMVLYPAIDDAGDAVPDYANPITTNNLTLDPATAGVQSLSVDYASGMVYLSHPPVPGVGCDIAPNGIVGTGGNNPRGEIVLYAACVPLSREKSPALTLAGTDRQGQTQSIYGKRITVPLVGQVDGADQTFTDGVDQEIILAVDATTDPLPAAGFIDLINGVSPYGDPTQGGNPVHPTLTFTRATTFGYYSKDIVTDTVTSVDHVRLRGVYGGADASTAVTVAQEGDVTAVLRRDIVTPQKDDGSLGTDYQFDTTFGAAPDAPAMVLAGAELTVDANGSTAITFPRFTESQNLVDELFSSWLLNGGAVTALGGSDQGRIGQTVVLIRGVRTIIPATVYTFGLVGTTEYLYVRSNDPNYPRFEVAASLPLPRKDDVLLAKVTMFLGVIDIIEDLRRPLTEMDKRLDITVGEFVGTQFIGQPSPHFDTLGKAIAYVGAIMDPTVGDSGNYLRIKIVGTTTESKSAPIVLPCNGVIVEGAGQPQTQGAGGAHGIVVSGQGVGVPCIDMNGKEDWVWRNIQFVKDAQVVLGPGADPVRRTLFGGGCKRFLFDGCNFDGADNAHGFIYADTIFEDATIRGCEVKGVTDFGVYVADTATMRNLLIDHCIFTATTGGVYETTLTDQAGVRLPNSNSVPGPMVRDSRFQEFLFGIVSGSRDCTLKGNRIVSTIQTGIVLVPHISTLNETLIEGNTLNNVWTLGGAGIGVVLGTGLSRVTIRDNLIALSGVPVATSKDIAGVGVDHIRILGNECLYGDVALTTSDYVQIVGNTIRTGGILLSGDDGLVEGNQVLGTLTSAGVLAGGGTTSCLLGASYRCRVSNNHCLNGLDLGNGAGNCENAVVTANTILAALRLRSVSGVHINNNHVSGNIIDQLTAPDLGAVNSVILTGNFSGEIILGAASTNSIVQGNKCTGQIRVLAPTLVQGNIATSLDTENTSAGSTYIGNILSGNANIEHTAYTFVGNKAADVTNVAGAGFPGDPDVAGGIAVGNKVASGSLFGVGVAGSPKDNNVA